jgi:hypothetical protein
VFLDPIFWRCPDCGRVIESYTVASLDIRRNLHEEEHKRFGSSIFDFNHLRLTPYDVKLLDGMRVGFRQPDTRLPLELSRRYKPKQA